MNIRSNPDTTLPAVTTGPLPASRKIWVIPDEAPDVRVPLREIIGIAFTSPGWPARTLVQPVFMSLKR